MNTQALVTEFVAYLRSRGMRMTPERRHILQHIFSAHTHFEVDDLHVRLRDAGHRISKATVYRTVALLANCGILRSSIAPADLPRSTTNSSTGWKPPTSICNARSAGACLRLRIRFYSGTSDGLPSPWDTSSSITPSK